MIEILKTILWRPVFRLVSKTRTWYSNRFVIPPYSEKRQIILYYKKRFNCNNFVETGTFMGDKIDRMKDHFTSLYSIELSEELAAKADKRFQNYPHITILHGDSGKKLAEIINTLSVTPKDSMSVEMKPF